MFAVLQKETRKKTSVSAFSIDRRKQYYDVLITLSTLKSQTWNLLALTSNKIGPKAD
jgi:hypothetical protein